MSESGLDRELHLLSDDESLRIFLDRIVPTEFAGVAGVDRPVVHFFGGQPGAGKSVAQGAVTTAIIAADGIGAVASIIGDDFRPHHPAYNRLLAEDDEAAAFYTDLDSGRWVEQAIAWAIEHRPHVILEGTFRRPGVTIESAKNFTDSSFEAHVHVLAVHKFVSRTRIFGRYYDQLRANGKGRYTLPAAHDASYDSLPASVEAILDSGVFSDATAYDAWGSAIVKVSGQSAAAIPNAVRSAHDTLPSDDEIGDLLGLLDRFEDTFVSLGKAVVVHDLQALRLEILGATR
ncbi:zeta toxin family protein [Nocardioides sp.]|uniref:zeta toxin family protein n=1 Tax=Nocardioides sp. TaxID=35761 RepID=UPI0039E4BA49